MSNELALPSNFDPALAEMMGTSVGGNSGPSIARLAIQQTALKGEVEVAGKKIKTEVVPVGFYRLTLPDDTVVYAPQATIRVFAKRMHWGMWDSEKNVMYKTVMAHNLNGDLKDNRGTFNIGRPSGYIKDFDSLPKATKDVMRAVKRVTVVMGEVSLSEVVDADGNPVTGYDTAIPFIMEVRSAQGTKNLNEVLGTIDRKKVNTLQYYITLTTSISTKPDGAEIGTLEAKLGDASPVSEDDVELVRNFFDYISRTNAYILDKWKENNKEVLSDDDADLIASMVQVEEAD